MKAERRKTVVSIADTQLQGGISAWFSKYGNSLLTGILIAMAVALLVRWRLGAAAVAKQDILNQLHEARSRVDQLHGLGMQQGSPADLIKTVQSIETDANGKLSNVLNTSDDAKVRAQALVIRGDLYWQLANLPELPGSDSEPTLRLKKTPDELLGQAADAYTAVITPTDFAGEHDEINSARLGLAAIAENHNDWAGARKQLDAIKNDPASTGEKHAAADFQLALMVGGRQLGVMVDDPQLGQMLGDVQDPIYVAPPTGTPGPTTAPTVSRLLGPALPTTRAK